MAWHNKMIKGLIFPILAVTLVACSTQHAGVSSVDDADEASAMADGEHYPRYADDSTHAVKRDSSGFVVNEMAAPRNQTYYFAFDQSTLREQDLAAIELQAHYLVEHPSAVVRLQGNTDNVGSREYNIALGWRRDQSVQHILKQYGVRDNQIKMVSYGKERPARLGDTALARALSRRVELVYMAG